VNAQSRPIQFERRGNGNRAKLGMPKKAKRWSHQDELEALKGQEVSLFFAHRVDDMDYVTGMLVNADQYTIQLALGSQSLVTYFKSDLRSYSKA
jgi:hypothetical protein